jgi:transposase-like protein
LLGQWRRSGQTARDFCAVHGLSEPSFYAWRRELARRDEEGKRRSPTPRRTAIPRRRATRASATFLPVRLDAAVASVACALEVIVAGGRVLRVRPGFDADLLRQLLAVLEEPSC